MHTPVRIIAHSGSFHADDIFACATLSIVLEKEGKEFEIIRSRDEEVIKTGDYVVDVGGIYDESQNRFDHHQIGGAGVRENGIPYASFGLVWKKFGKDLVGSDHGAERIDQKIVQSIDGPDNGVSIATPIFEDVFPYEFHTIVSSYLPTWKELNFDYDGVFKELVMFAKSILSREIKKIREKEEGELCARELYKQSPDPKLLILDKPYPWGTVADEFEELLFVVTPSKDSSNDWKINTVKKTPFSFENRKDLPETWAGLHDEELQKVTGIFDVSFCHTKKFLCIAKSKESAVALAKLAILA